MGGEEKHSTEQPRLSSYDFLAPQLALLAAVPYPRRITQRGCCIDPLSQSRLSVMLSKTQLEYPTRVMRSLQ